MPLRDRWRWCTSMPTSISPTATPRQGRHSQSSGMRRSLELERVDPKRCVQVGTRNFNFPSSKAFIDKVGLTDIPASRVFSDGVPAALATIDRPPVALIGSLSRSMSTCSIRHMRQEWDGTNPVVSPPGNCSTSWWRWRRAPTGGRSTRSTR